MKTILMLYICMTPQSTPGAADCPGIPQRPWYDQQAVDGTCDRLRAQLDKQLTPTNRKTIHLECVTTPED